MTVKSYFDNLPILIKDAIVPDENAANVVYPEEKLINS